MCLNILIARCRGSECCGPLITWRWHWPWGRVIVRSRRTSNEPCCCCNIVLWTVSGPWTNLVMLVGKLWMFVVFSEKQCVPLSRDLCTVASWLTVILVITVCCEAGLCRTMFWVTFGSEFSCWFGVIIEIWSVEFLRLSAKYYSVFDGSSSIGPLIWILVVSL